MNQKGKIISLCLFLLFTPFFPSPLLSEPPPDTVSLSGDYDAFTFEAPPLIFEVPGFEPRSINDVFPGLTRIQRANIMSGKGVRNAFEKSGSPTLVTNPNLGINLIGGIMEKKPSHIIEALVLVPYNMRVLDLLDIYNALRKIKRIQDQTIPAKGGDVKMFKETTRLESAQRRRPVSDPPRADTLPDSETTYLRFVDQYMGDLYIQGKITVSAYGITYSLSNFRDVYFSIFRVMKAESFSAIVYLEPVKEGMLIYGMSGIYLPEFISRRINLTPNMNNRITALVNWITEGLREEENYSQRNAYYRH